jgi:hypothetical protein
VWFCNAPITANQSRVGCGSSWKSGLLAISAAVSSPERTQLSPSRP